MISQANLEPIAIFSPANCDDARMTPRKIIFQEITQNRNNGTTITREQTTITDTNKSLKLKNKSMLNITQKLRNTTNRQTEQRRRNHKLVNDTNHNIQWPTV